MIPPRKGPRREGKPASTCDSSETHMLTGQTVTNAHCWVYATTSLCRALRVSSSRHGSSRGMILRVV
ncbi:Ribosomal RNA large subunit methyltransferase F [Frankliniella fusca]|uniref:Ribosomal RNA large subunit methyltransferase F n=1 Tax=Frankliniella fusca TaxID=407009 RepID=A0AAE1HRR1_9NEOP|nr:Ribosomal RNA large subunit methyltransferase F [Frankliniella fusca]